MIVNLSEAASNTMLNAIAGMMDGGSIELLSGDGKALAVLKLSNPAATGRCRSGRAGKIRARRRVGWQRNFFVRCRRRE